MTGTVASSSRSAFERAWDRQARGRDCSQPPQTGSIQGHGRYSGPSRHAPITEAIGVALQAHSANYLQRREHRRTGDPREWKASLSCQLDSSDRRRQALWQVGFSHSATLIAQVFDRALVRRETGRSASWPRRASPFFPAPLQASLASNLKRFQICSIQLAASSIVVMTTHTRRSRHRCHGTRPKPAFGVKPL